MDWVPLHIVLCASNVYYQHLLNVLNLEREAFPELLTPGAAAGLLLLCVTPNVGDDPLQSGRSTS